jgi:hypothetical protein
MTNAARIAELNDEFRKHGPREGLPFDHGRAQEPTRLSGGTAAEETCDDDYDRSANGRNHDLRAIRQPFGERGPAPRTTRRKYVRNSTRIRLTSRRRNGSLSESSRSTLAFGICFRYITASVAWDSQASPTERTFDPLPPDNPGGCVDQATNLLQQGPFDRATAHLLCRVLEEGWAQIHTSYAGAPAQNVGRRNVADGLLAYAMAGQRDPEALKVYAVTRALRLLGRAAVAPKSAA